MINNKIKYLLKNFYFLFFLCFVLWMTIIDSNGFINRYRLSKKLSELKAKLPKYFSTPEMRMACESDEEKFRIADEAIKYFTKNYDCITVDGVRIKFGDGWGLVRSSNTQPVIVCRFEANSHDRMEEIKDLVLAKLETMGKIKLDVH